MQNLAPTGFRWGLFCVCGALGGVLRRGQVLTRPTRLGGVATALRGLQRGLFVEQLPNCFNDRSVSQPGWVMVKSEW